MAELMDAEVLYQICTQTRKEQSSAEASYAASLNIRFRLWIRWTDHCKSSITPASNPSSFFSCKAKHVEELKHLAHFLRGYRHDWASPSNEIIAKALSVRKNRC
jgi:hypothetical protein